MESDTTLNTNLSAAHTLQKSLTDAPLRILGDRDKFKSHRLEGVDDWSSEPGVSADDAPSRLRDPAVVADNVAAQIVSVLKTQNIDLYCSSYISNQIHLD